MIKIPRLHFLPGTLWALPENRQDVIEQWAAAKAALPLPANGDGPGEGSGGISGGIAVLALHGPVIPRANIFSRYLGWTALDTFRARYRTVMADESVSAVVLDVDSPGGEVTGLAETAELIRALRGVKPVVAISNPLNASAAYYLSSQAGKVVAAPDSFTGSIGTVMVHTEFSKALEAEGVKVTVVRSPKGKYRGNQFEPLDADTAARWQQIVDAFTEQFVQAVAKGRGVSAAKVRGDFGGGDVLLAKETVAAGMADAVGTLDSVIALLAGRKRKGVSAQALLADWPADLPAAELAESGQSPSTLSGPATAPAAADMERERQRALTARYAGRG